jgi:hypothetical protein
MLAMLISMTTFVSLTNTLPPTTGLPWLTRFVLASFFFNLIAMIEQVVVSFGYSAKKWLDAQHKDVSSVRSWKDMLLEQREQIIEMFRTWDVDQNGMLSKQEFRHGIVRLYADAPLHEVNGLFNALDVNGNGKLSVDELAEWMHVVHDASLANKKAGKQSPQIKERLYQYFIGDQGINYEEAQPRLEDMEVRAAPLVQLLASHAAHIPHEHAKAHPHPHPEVLQRGASWLVSMPPGMP